MDGWMDTLTDGEIDRTTNCATVHTACDMSGACLSLLGPWLLNLVPIHATNTMKNKQYHVVSDVSNFSKQYAYLMYKDI